MTVILSHSPWNLHLHSVTLTNICWYSFTLTVTLMHIKTDNHILKLKLWHKALFEPYLPLTHADTHALTLTFTLTDSLRMTLTLTNTDSHTDTDTSTDTHSYCYWLISSLTWTLTHSHSDSHSDTHWHMNTVFHTGADTDTLLLADTDTLPLAPKGRRASSKCTIEEVPSEAL